jgi:hypothetical protein
MNKKIAVPLALLAGLTLPAARAFAHVSPPVVLASEAETLRNMIGRSDGLVVQRIKLNPAERQSVRQRCACKANDVSYRAYLAGPEGGRAAAVIFLSEPTQHGPVRVAVGLGRDGRVTAARVVEVTEESLNWLKPLIDQDLPGDYVGRGSGDDFGISERFEKMRLESMRRFYARVVSSLIRRAAILYDVTMRPRD